MIVPRYQATDALALVPGEPSWSYQVVRIPLQDASLNYQVVKVVTEVGEDRDRIHLASTSTGIMDWEERANWWNMLPSERNKNLKETLERKDPALQIEKAEVGAYRQGPFGWSCDAVRERDVSRHLQVHPFPLLEPPLYLPADLTAKRTERIVLPHIGLQEYQAIIKCPPGYTWSGPGPLKQANAFGEVSWETGTGASPSEISVMFTVRTTTLLAQASAYPEFTTFLSWVREAMSRTLTLTRSSS
jgi:hypothetical protein